MAFTELTTGIEVSRAGVELRVDWTSALPGTTVWQVYLNRRLAWSGTDRHATYPRPSDTMLIDVGSVGSAAEANVDYSGSLSAAPPGTKANLSWQGGLWQGADLAGFRIYRSATAGGSVDYITLIDYVPVGDTGVGGWGTGGWGQGGWGDTGGVYSWTSESLGPGVWTFAVVPVDVAGNAQGSPSATNATIAGPPRPPAPYSDGTRLRYSFNAGSPILTWNAAP